ncbi:caffeic acid 3-O-methyltransferase-like [Pistacia vera]|uniref:caffeic acid 3-O-methyltransferase-like n=1 Tax=Pistacia vera TaxID=55513 RepID=UPI001263976F|nr:caffeic acid 3-O-methyltransferase-like [Pistacia vera]
MNSEENQMKTSTNEEDDHIHGQYAIQLVSASVLPMVLKATIELGVLDIIDKAGPGGLAQGAGSAPGGGGSILKMIIFKYPTIKCVNYDLPSIIEKSTSYPGMEHVAGDIFVDIPKGEAIFVKWMLHSWDDKHCVKILKNCHEALPAHGKVDLVIPEAPETILAAKSLFQLDMLMMNMNSRGKDRTRKEFQSLGEDAWYSHIQVPCSAFNFSVIEFYKSI